MKAICLEKEQELNLKEVPTPKKAKPGHLLIKIEACGINPGDKAFIGGAFPPGSIPESLYGICGVSAAGRVIEVGEGVPKTYKEKNVSIYKSLKFSDSIVGTWSEFAHMHYHHCLILPRDANFEEFSGSLVNSITPYAFHKQIIKEGHKGIICTAGNSATGRAMLGVCLAYNIPVISIVRNNIAKSELAPVTYSQTTKIPVGKTIKINGRPWKFAVELNYYVTHYDTFGPQWMIGVNIAPVVKNVIANWIN